MDTSNFKYFRVTVETPNGHLSGLINWNTSKEAAIEQTKNALGMEQPAEWVNACKFPLVEEVIPDPNNKYHYIPVVKEKEYKVVYNVIIPNYKIVSAKEEREAVNKVMAHLENLGVVSYEFVTTIEVK